MGDVLRAIQTAIHKLQNRGHQTNQAVYLHPDAAGVVKSAGQELDGELQSTIGTHVETSASIPDNVVIAISQDAVRYRGLDAIAVERIGGPEPRSAEEIRDRIGELEEAHETAADDVDASMTAARIEALHWALGGGVGEAVSDG